MMLLGNRQIYVPHLKMGLVSGPQSPQPFATAKTMAKITGEDSQPRTTSDR